MGGLEELTMENLGNVEEKFQDEFKENYKTDSEKTEEETTYTTEEILDLVDKSEDQKAKEAFDKSITELAGKFGIEPKEGMETVLRGIVFIEQIKEAYGQATGQLASSAETNWKVYSKDESVRKNLSKLSNQPDANIGDMQVSLNAFKQLMEGQAKAKEEKKLWTDEEIATINEKLDAAVEKCPLRGNPDGSKSDSAKAMYLLSDDKLGKRTLEFLGIFIEAIEAIGKPKPKPQAPEEAEKAPEVVEHTKTLKLDAIKVRASKDKEIMFPITINGKTKKLFLEKGAELIFELNVTSDGKFDTENIRNINFSEKGDNNFNQIPRKLEKYIRDQKGMKGLDDSYKDAEGRKRHLELGGYKDYKSDSKRMKEWKVSSGLYGRLIEAAENFNNIKNNLDSSTDTDQTTSMESLEQARNEVQRLFAAYVGSIYGGAATSKFTPDENEKMAYQMSSQSIEVKYSKQTNPVPDGTEATSTKTSSKPKYEPIEYKSARESLPSASARITQGWENIKKTTHTYDHDKEILIFNDEKSSLKKAGFETVMEEYDTNNRLATIKPLEKNKKVRVSTNGNSPETRDSFEIKQGEDEMITDIRADYDKNTGEVNIGIKKLVERDGQVWVKQENVTLKMVDENENEAPEDEQELAAIKKAVKKPAEIKKTPEEKEKSELTTYLNANPEVKAQAKKIKETAPNGEISLAFIDKGKNMELSYFKTSADNHTSKYDIQHTAWRTSESATTERNKKLSEEDTSKIIQIPGNQAMRIKKYYSAK